MSCIYRYKNQTFNSEAELDDFLIEKFGYESKFGDIIFNKSGNFLRTKDIIENKIMKDAERQEHLMKIRNARLRASYYDGDEILNLDPPYIGVNKFMQGLVHPETGLVVPEFRLEEEYWPRRKEKWTEPLKSDETILDRFTDDEIDVFFDADPSKTYSSKEEELADKKNNVRLLSEDECKQMETLMKKKWEFQAAAGTAIHYVLQQYFTKDDDGNLIGDQPRDEIVDLIMSKIDSELSEQMGDSKYRAFRGKLFNKDIINQALIFADDLKSKLRSKYGKTCEFYPELSISASLNMTSQKYPNVKTILGIIDLLVVDESGQVHYFDYKTSPKPYDKFDTAKRRTYQLQLAMYGKLLKRYHLNYRESDISILPIQFDNLKLDNPDEAHINPDKAQYSYSGITPKSGIFESDTKSKIFEVDSRGEEKILGILDDYVTEDLVLDVSGNELLSNVQDQLKTWFPDYNKFKAKTTDEIKELLEKEGAFKPVERDGKQIYVYQARGAYSKEITAKDEFELVEKVKKQQEKQEKRAEQFQNTVRKALKYGIDNTTADIGQFVASIDTKNLSDPTAYAKWFTEKLGAYCNGNWSLVKIDALNALGIIALQNNKTNQIDIIKLSNSNLYYNPFNTELKNGKRIKKKNSLLSYAFQNDIAETSNQKSLMLEGYKGNVELMETILALNNIPQLFEGPSGAVIGNIQVMNPFQGNGISATNEELLYTFNKLNQLSPLKSTNNIKEGKVKLGTTFDIGVNSFNEAMESSQLYEIDNSQFNSAKSLLDQAIADTDREEKVEAIQNIIYKLEQAHEDLRKGKITREMLLTKPYARLYNELLQALRYLNGINFRQQVYDHDKWVQEKTFKGIITKGLSGTYIDNPGNMLSETLNTVAKLVTQAYQNIRNKMGGRVAEIRKATEELKQHKQYTGVAQAFGNATDMYKNMTEVVGGDLLFTDLRSNKLDDVERKYLKLILEVINENRFGGKKSKEELERMRDTHDLAYYRVPLCKGTAESQDSVIGLQKGLQERLRRFNPKTAMNDIAATVNGLFMGEEVDSYQNGEFLFQMNNRFDKSESSPQYRIEAISKNGEGYFERNLEMLAFKHSYSYIASKELNKVFPIMKAAMTYLSAAGNTVNKTFENDEEYFENYIKASVKGQQIQNNEDMKQATAFAGRIKQIASFMALAFSPVQAMYQTIQGLWQDISLIVRKPDGTEAFTWANMWDAARTVYADLRHFSDKPTKCQLINEWLGVNDMDMNIYADRMRTDQHNKYNFVNFAFKFASRPDYYNRMTIIVAKMKADGIWDALDVVDGKLVYNFKKDKRFSAYAYGETTNPEYNNQRALYRAIADQFIVENTENPDGTKFQLSKDPMHPTPLPYAWTNQEAESVKSLCDLIYGYYSHEKKSLIHATFLGALYMQMKTYWSGKKNQYLQPGGVRIQGKWEQAIDPETKKPLYYQTDEKGIIDYTAPLTTTVTDAPFYQWKGQFQEGIILTLSTIFRNGLLSKEGLKQGWQETWDNEDINIRTARRANIKQFGFDLIFYGMISGLIAGLFMADWDKELKKEAKESGDLGDALKSTVVHLSRVSLGQSAEDLAWWESIGSPTINWSPFALIQTTNTTKRLWNSIIGDKSFYDGVMKSFAAGKQMGPLVDWLNPKNFE